MMIQSHTAPQVWRGALWCLITATFVFLPNESIGQDPAAEDVGIAGTIQRVTLYRDRALVSREIVVPADQSAGVLTITGLPEQLVPESVYAESAGGVEVRAVEVATRETTLSSREEVRKLEESLTELDATKNELNAELELIEVERESLDKLVAFAASKTSDDLNRGTLDASAVIEIDTYARDSRKELLQRALKISMDLDALEKQIQEQSSELDGMVSNGYRQLIEAKIFIDKQPGTEGTLTLNYLVAGCRWTPRYSIRGSVDNQSFMIQYSAIVSQVSGEDWSDVALTLSTGSPGIDAAGPNLNPFTISTTASNQNQVSQQALPGNAPVDSKQLAERYKSIQSQLKNVENSFSNSASFGQGGFRDSKLNELAGEIQRLELTAEAKSAVMIASESDQNAVSQTYVLTQPVSLASRKQNQLVRIANLDLEGDMYHVATPLLSTYAYRRAEMVNTESVGLIEGPADVYLDDRFVGVTEIPNTAAGQRLLVGFGADEQVRTRRELRSKEEFIRGGNRSLQFTYRLVIANFKDTAVNIRLFDRIPSTKESQDVSVKLTPPELPISEDVLYGRTLKDRGILRWDLDVPGGSHTDSAFDVEYTYQLEFDRSRVLLSQELERQTMIDSFAPNAAPMGTGMGGMGGGMGGGVGGFGGGNGPQP